MRLLAALLPAALLLAGCAGGPGDGDGDGFAAAGDAAADVPAPEAGIAAGQVNRLSQVSIPFGVGAGHGRLAVTLVLASSVASSLSMNVTGPDRSADVDTGPFLYVFPGTRPTVSFAQPEAGEWTATVTLEGNGVAADYEVHWCADASERPGPQGNLACQRSY